MPETLDAEYVLHEEGTSHAPSSTLLLHEERDDNRRRVQGWLLSGSVLGAFVAGCIFGMSLFGGIILVARVPTIALESVSPPSVMIQDCDHSVAIKRTVCQMDHALVGLGDEWKNYATFETAMKPYWDESFRYVPMRGIDESVGLDGWFKSEMWTWTTAFPWVSFNQMIFVGSGPNASTTTYAVGDWEGNLGVLAPSGKRMLVRICDFYVSNADGRIGLNYMMIDTLDLLRQQDVYPLALSPLPQGRVSPPVGDGMPAPLTRYTRPESAAADARRVVTAALEEEWVGTSTALLHWETDFVWWGPVPFGMATGRAQLVEHFLRPFHAAFAEDSRSLSFDVFACEGDFCATRVTFSGRHTGAWLGIPPSGLVLRLEAGMHWRVRNGKIVEAWAIFDLPRMLLPLGIDLLKQPPEQREEPALEPPALAATTPENNECANAYTVPPDGDDDDFDCPAFVIRSTDETWHPRSWEKTSSAVDKYFAEDWQSVRAFGMMLRGRESLRAFMKDWLGGFPDVFIHVADVFCLGNTRVGYKTTMPYVLTATHAGWSKAFGKPSGRKVKYHGIANCYIKREAVSGQWQYTTEWDLPDMWAFITALNLTAAEMPPHPAGDLVPVDQCKPLFEWGTGEMNWFPPSA